MSKTPASGHPARWSREPLLDAITRALVALGESPAMPDELRRLQQQGLLDAAEQGELSAAELADSIKKWRADTSEAAEAATTADTATGALVGTAPTSQPLMLPTGGALPDDSALTRRYAISRVLTADLADDLTVWEQIARFRREALGGRALTWEEVERWVSDQRLRDGPPGFLLTEVPISAEQVSRGTESAPLGYTTLSLTVTAPLPQPERPPVVDAGARAMGTLERRLLVYLLPGRANPAWTFVAIGGVLDDLLRLSEFLASETVRPWWSKAQAATFILTGLAPFVAVYKGLDYVIDPLLPLNQIVEQVAQLRRALVGERAREMDLKHLNLAVFAAERPEEPWAIRMEAWNATYPEWQYPDTQKSNFIRDSLAAKRRLLLQARQ